MGTMAIFQGILGPSDCSKLLILFGGRGRNRTYNLSVKSRMLCQLSYASVETLVCAAESHAHNIREARKDAVT